MPIAGLTDRKKGFIRLCKIKKGDKDERGNPRDLDYFRTVFSEGLQDLEFAFRTVYGEKPTRINFRLAFPNISDSWDAYYVCYETGGLLAKAGSDERGLYWVWYRDHETKEVLVRDKMPVGSRGQAFIQKPIDLSAPVYTYQNRKNENVPVYLEPEGRLSIVIPELAYVGGKAYVGYFDFCPTSPRDIGTLSAELDGIQAMAMKVGKDITGIPMVLTRRKEQVTKNIKGVLSRGPSWVVHIELAGVWGEKVLEVMQMKALPEFVDGEVEEIREAEFVDEDHAPAPQNAITIPAQSNPDAEPEKKPEPASRPYTPEQLKVRFGELVSSIEKKYTEEKIALEAGENERRVLASTLDGIFGDKGLSRHPFCDWLVNIDSTTLMSAAQVKAFFVVMGIKNTAEHPATFNDAPSSESIQEFKQAYDKIINK